MIHLLDQFIKLILIKFCFISHINVIWSDYADLKT
ncbi:Uncharacterised protein [Mannheimia haemolytica]|uniref:Uncharacterized protein n=1 Tax=Mannheimia haemolytica TaxID=75985 RepID=A0A3S4XQ68_MANHA|nr:Uncharacterised protein [Mannheimia haemolytica]